MPAMEDDEPDPSSGGTDVLRLPPNEEIGRARAELWRLRRDDAWRINRDAWVRRWRQRGYHVSKQLIDNLLQQLQQEQQIQQQRQQQEQQEQQRRGTLSPPKPPPAPDDMFEIEFAPEFSPEDVEAIASSLSDYFRACGGAGFEYEFAIEEPVDPERS